VEVQEPRVVDSPERRRYELWVDDTLAGKIVYRARSEDVLALIHTEVEPAFEGQGLAAKLVAGALEDVRRRGLTVVPICAFVRSYLERNPADADLIAPRAGRTA
jgi:uncharacterized protein